MSKFCIGDHVIAITAVDGNVSTKNKTGVVKALHYGNWDVVCEFDQQIERGYNPGGYSESNNGWCGHDDDFELISKDRDIYPINPDEYDKII